MSKRKFLSKDEILAAKDDKSEVLEIPEWGGCVSIRALRGKELNAIQQLTADLEDKPDANDYRMGCFVAMCLADEQGGRLFSNEDVPALLEKSMAVLIRLQTKALKVNGLTRDEVEDLAKNSEGAQSADSTSA